MPAIVVVVVVNLTGYSDFPNFNKTANIIYKNCKQFI